MDYNIQTFIEKLDFLLKKSKMTAKELTKTLDISSSSVSEWKKGKTVPSIKSVIGISKIYDVSLDWLLLGQEKSYILAPDEKELVDYYRKLDDIEKGRILGTLEIKAEQSHFTLDRQDKLKSINSQQVKTKNTEKIS